jgi:hypothetical protein
MCRDGWQRQAIGKRVWARSAGAEIISRGVTAAPFFFLQIQDENGTRKAENGVVCQGT